MAPVAKVASGTITQSTASTLTFASACKNCVIITNNNANANYAYINFNGGAATVSATVHDTKIAQHGTLILTREHLQNFPISTLTVFTAEATPAIRAVGW